jgi:hypothetical protein
MPIKAMPVGRKIIRENTWIAFTDYPSGSIPKQLKAILASNGISEVSHLTLGAASSFLITYKTKDGAHMIRMLLHDSRTRTGLTLCQNTMVFRFIFKHSSRNEIA